MNNKINKYVDKLFEDGPKNRRTYELKEEILANLNDRYNDLIESGVDENTAYSRAISNIGDVEELIQKNSASIEQEENYRKKSEIRTSIAIMLYILCPVPVLIFGDSIGVVLLFIFIASATGMLIYDPYAKPKSLKIDDDLYKEFIDWKENTQESRKFERQVSSIVWSITTIVYFLVSFNYGNWDISWIIFLIGGVAQKIIRASFDLRGDGMYEKK